MSEHRVTRKEKGEDSSYPKGIEVLLEETARKGYPDTEEVDNPMVSAHDMMVVNPDESWSSNTEIFGYDQQICPGIFPFL